MMFQLKTIRQGERVAIWDKQGRVRYVDGPRRLLLWNKKIQPLKRYSAHADQFLAIQFTDGHCEHLLGPSAVWFDPVEHQTIDVKEALHLDSNEAIVGYQVNRVVYRGYSASDTLQSMHDGAIEARTRLKLEAETENQAQDIADLKQARDAVRAQQRQAVEREQAEHEVSLKRLEHEDRLSRVTAQRKAKRDARRESNQIALEHRQAINQQKATYLASMREMQVDLTRYLVAQYQHPDRLIRISGDSSPQLHLHQNERNNT